MLTEQKIQHFYLQVSAQSTTNVHFKAVFASLIGAGRVEDVRFEHEKRNSSTQPPNQALELANKRDNGELSQPPRK